MKSGAFRVVWLLTAWLLINSFLVKTWSLWSKRSGLSVNLPNRWVVNFCFVAERGRWMEVGRHSCQHSLILQLLKSSVESTLLVEETQTMCPDPGESREESPLLGKSFYEIWSDGFRMCGEIRAWPSHKTLPHSSEEQAEPGICLLSSLCHCYPLVHAQHTPTLHAFLCVHICALACYLPTLFLVLVFVCLLSTFFTDVYTHSSFCWNFFLLSCPFGLLCLVYLGMLYMFEA